MWMYLRYVNGGYEINVLGKNGEPKPGMELSINLEHEYIKNLYNKNFVLETDKNGKVQLGNLENVNRISAKLVAS